MSGCYEAALAQLAGALVDELPPLTGEDWGDRVRSFLEPRGFSVRFVPGSALAEAPGPAIVSYALPNGKVHAEAARRAPPRCVPLLWTLLEDLR